MKVTEAIILAGGLGTRLRSEVPDLPKCMAPVAGRPFLAHLIDYLRLQGIEKFIFSIGYLGEQIEAFLASDYPTLQYACVWEREPLGTGGGIAFALREAKGETVLLTNGDTLFRFDLVALLHIHEKAGAECTLSLCPMENFARYGTVSLDTSGRITAFHEKQPTEKGLINAGVYLLQTDAFRNRSLPQKFSFEQHYLEAFSGEGKFFGAVQQAFFIDIGVPEDYRRAQTELQRPEALLQGIDRSWTLFLDRDGVINHEIQGEYVLHHSGFRFLDGVPRAVARLAGIFGRILIVSNQRGIGRGLMTEADLQAIHDRLKEGIQAAGGRIDHIFYCTEKDDLCLFRKPNPGMALLAKRAFPEIDLQKSIMVGNKPSDMRFGRAAGMVTVFVATTNPEVHFPHPDIDFRFADLPAFAAALEP